MPLFATITITPIMVWIIAMIFLVCVSESMCIVKGLKRGNHIKPQILSRFISWFIKLRIMKRPSQRIIVQIKGIWRPWIDVSAQQNVHDAATKQYVDSNTK